jgi:tetratricopeptide (TPR) repeat protein
MLNLSRVFGTLSGAVVVCALIAPAQALKPAEVSAIAKQVTVMISSQNPGSGVIINRSGDTYTVLTAFHVVNTPDEYEVIAPDEKSYRLDYQTVKRLPNLDLAILQFKSAASYDVVKLGNTRSVSEGGSIYVSGFPLPSEAINLSIYNFSSGQLIANSTKLLADGYSLVYSNNTQPGMSGGPVFDEVGQLIGIHGRSDAKIQNGVYFKNDKNLGLAIDTFMAAAPKVGITVGSTAPLTPLPQTAQQPQSGTFYLSATDKYLRGDYKGALADFNQALKLNPNNAVAYQERAGVRFSLSDRIGAIADLDQALRLDPQLALAYAYRGVYRAASGNQSGAQADVEQALRLDPSSGRAARGIVRWYGGDRAGAQTDFDQALSVKSDPSQMADIHYARGVLRWQLNNYSGALNDFNDAIKLQPKYTEVYGMRALLKYNSGDPEAARSDLQRALQLNPNEENVYLVSSLTSLAQGDYQKALADANRVAQLAPTADIYAIQGMAYLQLGNASQAIAAFNTGAQRVSDAESRKTYQDLVNTFSQIPLDNPLALSLIQQEIAKDLPQFTQQLIDTVVQEFRPLQES